MTKTDSFSFRRHHYYRRAGIWVGQDANGDTWILADGTVVALVQLPEVVDQRVGRAGLTLMLDQPYGHTPLLAAVEAMRSLPFDSAQQLRRRYPGRTRPLWTYHDAAQAQYGTSRATVVVRSKQITITPTRRRSHQKVWQRSLNNAALDSYSSWFMNDQLLGAPTADKVSAAEALDPELRHWFRWRLRWRTRRSAKQRISRAQQSTPAVTPQSSTEQLVQQLRRYVAAWDDVARSRGVSVLQQPSPRPRQLLPLTLNGLLRFVQADREE